MCTGFSEDKEEKWAHFDITIESLNGNFMDIVHELQKRPYVPSSVHDLPLGELHERWLYDLPLGELQENLRRLCKLLRQYRFKLMIEEHNIIRKSIITSVVRASHYVQRVRDFRYRNGYPF